MIMKKISSSDGLRSSNLLLKLCFWVPIEKKIKILLILRGYWCYLNYLYTYNTYGNLMLVLFRRKHLCLL